MFVGEDGRITRFSADPADLAKARRLPSRAILPGLVNAHSHAFQRLIRGRTEHRTAAQRDTFWTWRENMYCAANLVLPEALYYAARMAYLEMLLGGITTVGEFHYIHHGPGGVPYENRNLMALDLVHAAEATGLRVALLRTAYVRAGHGKAADPAQARFLTPNVEDFMADTEALQTEVQTVCGPGRGWVGVAPHSVRAVPLNYLREVVRYARGNGMPIHMHVAEQLAEVTECVEEHRLSPVALLHEHGLLDARFTGIHAIHVTDQEIDYLAAARATVCACPITERNLGDGAAPADRWVDAGVRFCLGSDSNVQIDLLEDARSLEYDLRTKLLERVVLARDSSPDALAKLLFASATETGAQSLGAQGGKLEIGRPADFFTVDLNDPSIAGATEESLLSHIVFSMERTAIRDVSVGGTFVVRDGRHALGEEIVQEFAAVQRNLWSTKL
jgi:formimidoylglutamate deiminase